MTAVPTPQRSSILSAVRQLRLTPIDFAVAVAAEVSAVVLASDLVPQPAQGLLAVGVLVGAPAAAMGRALRQSDALSTFVTGVAFALAVLIAVSTSLLYLQRWSEANVLVVMTTLTFAMAVASSRLRQP